MKCKYCGYELKKYKGCINSDGKDFHKSCLENHLIRKLKEEKENTV